MKLSTLNYRAELNRQEKRETKRFKATKSKKRANKKESIY